MSITRGPVASFHTCCHWKVGQWAEVQDAAMVVWAELFVEQPAFDRSSYRQKGGEHLFLSSLPRPHVQWPWCKAVSSLLSESDSLLDEVWSNQILLLSLFFGFTNCSYPASHSETFGVVILKWLLRAACSKLQQRHTQFPWKDRLKLFVTAEKMPLVFSWKCSKS